MVVDLLCLLYQFSHLASALHFHPYTMRSLFGSQLNCLALSISRKLLLDDLGMTSPLREATVRISTHNSNNSQNHETSWSQIINIQGYKTWQANHNIATTTSSRKFTASLMPHPKHVMGVVCTFPAVG